MQVYVPEHFRETRPEVLQRFLAQHPLATLAAMTPQGLSAHHLPLRAQLSGADSGVLRGHIARANTLWRELADGTPVLAIFTGPDAYVSPVWYPSRAQHGKVVPTWNYAAVHVDGTIRFIHEEAWLRQLVTELTDTYEAGRADRWRVSDAPADYIEAMLAAIVGFEITITRIVAKFKGSQNRPAADRAAVAAALRAEGRNADEVAQLAPPERAD
jgi:transcriptional regulator